MRRFAPLLLVVAACGAESLYLPLPADGAGTLVFVVETDRGMSVSVHDLTDMTAIERDLDDGFTAVALLYADGPAALGLPAGVVEAVDAVECGARKLPDGAEIFVLDADERAWIAGDTTASIEAFRYAGTCPCPTLAIARSEDLPYRAVNTAAPIDDRAGLMYLRRDGSADAFRFTRDGLTMVDLGPPREVSELHVDGDVVWAADDRVLYRGTLDGGFVETATAQRGPIVDIDGTSDDLFVASEESELYHWDGATFERWFDRGAQRAGTKQHGFVLREGPGAVFALHQGLLAFERYVDGRVIERGEVVADTRGLVSVAHLEGFGHVLPAVHAEFFRYVGGELTGLSPPEAAEPTMMVKVGADAVVYGTNSGELVTFVAGYGFCPVVRPLDAPRIEAMVVLGDVLVVVGPPPGEGDLVRFMALELGL